MSDIRCVVAEELNVYPKNVGKFVKSARANSVNALFLLLHLLKGQAETIAQLLLAHSEQNTADPDSRTDLNVDRIRFACIPTLEINVFQFVVLWFAVEWPNPFQYSSNVLH